MKKLFVFFAVIGALGFWGYRALMNWTVDINPASIARSMTPEQRSQACSALSGGTEGGYRVCMEGMALAERGIQNRAIPDLSQPAEWARYKPGYTMELRSTWLTSFASNSQPGFGACLFDMVASSIDFLRFVEIQKAVGEGVDPQSIPELNRAINDCTNGTFHSLNTSSASTVPTETSSSDLQTSSASSVPYATERNQYWNAKCPKELRANDVLPLIKCDKGRGVTHAQKILGVNADSYFGNDTFNAVIDFQIQNDLPVTGNIDEQTWKKLDPYQTGPGRDLNGDGLVTPTEFR